MVSKEEEVRIRGKAAEGRKSQRKEQKEKRRL
jgi:hypothetical protein